MALESRAGVSNLPRTPPSPLVDLPREIMYKGYRIEPGSYIVGHGEWSPRVVVSVKSAEGAWRPTPIYSPSSAKFPTRAEADRRALDLATAWIDAAVQRKAMRRMERDSE